MYVLRIPDFPVNRHRAGARICPHCNGPVERVRRHFMDRLVSLIIPMRRYRCCARGWECTWEGRLP